MGNFSIKSIGFGILCFLIFPPCLSFAEDAKALEIMKKVDARDEGDNSISDMEMILIDKNNKQRIRKLRSYSKDFGEDSYRLMFFLQPADVKNTGFLTYDYDDANKDDDQWLYLPALRKSKRIATSDKSGSFMGSDFNYADMTSRDLEDYNYTLVKEVEVRGHKTWVIEGIPKNDGIIKEIGYKKSMVFVRQDNFVVVRGINWVDKGGRLKYFDVKNLQLIDNIWVPTEMSMTTKKGKKTIHKTVIKRNNIKFNQELDENMFTLRQLERGS